MAQFMGGVRGNRGKETRTGSKDSGMSAFAHGWDFGGQIRAFHDKDKKTDGVTLYLDGGSNGYRASTLIGVFYETDAPRQIAKKLREAARRLEGK